MLLLSLFFSTSEYWSVSGFRFWIFSSLFIYSVFGELIWSVSVKCHLCSVARIISLELQTLISHCLFNVSNQMSVMNLKSALSIQATYSPPHPLPPDSTFKTCFFCIPLHPSKPEFHSSSCLGQNFLRISWCLFFSHIPHLTQFCWL